MGFFLRLLEVGHKIHHVLVQVPQKSLLGYFLKPGFRVTHGGGSVPLDIAEIAVAVYQGQALFKILAHNHI